MMGYTGTILWTKHGHYSTTAPGVELRKLLLPYEMTSAKWRVKILGQQNRFQS
jgi:hypothetical protein